MGFTTLPKLWATVREYRAFSTVLISEDFSMVVIKRQRSSDSTNGAGSMIHVAFAIPIFILILTIHSTAMANPVRGLHGSAYLTLVDSVNLAERHEFAIAVNPGHPFERGELLFIITNSAEQTRSQESIWSGSSNDMDSSIKLIHTIPTLAPGQYHVGAQFRYLDESIGSISLSDGILIEITKDSLRTSRVSFRDIKLRLVRKELEARGLGGITYEEMKRLAPDLAAQLDELSQPRIMETPGATPDTANPTRQVKPPSAPETVPKRIDPPPIQLTPHKRVLILSAEVLDERLCARDDTENSLEIPRFARNDSGGRIVPIEGESPG
jgi:hypothetical protein